MKEPQVCHGSLEGSVEKHSRMDILANGKMKKMDMDIFQGTGKSQKHSVWIPPRDGEVTKFCFPKEICQVPLLGVF